MKDKAMKKSNFIAVAAALTGSAALLSACATPTAYGPATSARDTGYSQTALATGRYRVSFRGNSLTDRATVEDYLLFRAAELTLENGYDGFTVLRSDTDRNVQIRSTPRFGGGFYPGFSPYWGYYGRYGYNRWSPYYGDPFLGGGVDYDTIESYEAFATIGMFRGSANDAMSFDAADVIRTLRPRIEFPGENR